MTTPSSAPVVLPWLGQTRPTNCGQTCLAMLTGLSVETVEAVLGTKRTKTKDLVRFLRQAGWSSPDRLQRFTGVLEGPALGKLVQRRANGLLCRNWHWVVLLSDGSVRDPERPAGLSPGVLTSYLPLRTSAQSSCG